MDQRSSLKQMLMSDANCTEDPEDKTNALCVAVHKLLVENKLDILFSAFGMPFFTVVQSYSD